MKVAVVAADHVVCPEIFAVTEIIYVAAYERTLVAANVTVLPDKLISVVPVPPVTVMAYTMVQVVMALEVV